MIDEYLLDQYFNQFINNLNEWLPDGFVEIDLALLNKYHLLDFDKEGPSSASALNRYFHLIESSDKLTLFNEQFIIWIVPDTSDEVASTYTLIALNQGKTPHLEVGFKTRGVYNTSYFLLNFLEHFLDEIQDNEEALNRLKTTE